jgi:hypothetical protein
LRRRNKKTPSPDLTHATGCKHSRLRSVYLTFVIVYSGRKVRLHRVKTNGAVKQNFFSTAESLISLVFVIRAQLLNS